MEGDVVATAGEVLDEDFLFYSHLYSSMTVVFAMAVLSKFLTSELKFGFRSLLTLALLFIGEPLCHFLLREPSGVVLFGLGCVAIYGVLPGTDLPPTGKSVLITGCDSGFGHELAKKLDSIGATVFAACLSTNSQGALRLKKDCSERLSLIQLDVTDERQVHDSYEYISEQVGSAGLWGLVNNAGISYLSEIEMTSEKIFRKVLEVNLFGMVGVTKTFLPLIRKAKGRIVNMSSVSGRIAFEGFGAYCVSKSGLEAYTDVLRLEMKKWGVKVCTIEPSGFITEALHSDTIQIRKAEVWRTLDDGTKAEYGQAYFEKQFENFTASLPTFSKDLTPVVRVMCCALLSKSPLGRYAVGRGAGTLLFLFSLLPVWISDRLSASLSVCSVHDIRPSAMK